MGVRISEYHDSSRASDIAADPPNYFKFDTVVSVCQVEKVPLADRPTLTRADSIPESVRRRAVVSGNSLEQESEYRKQQEGESQSQQQKQQQKQRLRQQRQQLQRQQQQEYQMQQQQHGQLQNKQRQPVQKQQRIQQHQQERNPVQKQQEQLLKPKIPKMILEESFYI